MSGWLKSRLEVFARIPFEERGRSNLMKWANFEELDCERRRCMAQRSVTSPAQRASRIAMMVIIIFWSPLSVTDDLIFQKSHTISSTRASLSQRNYRLATDRNTRRSEAYSHQSSPTCILHPHTDWPVWELLAQACWRPTAVPSMAEEARKILW